MGEKRALFTIHLPHTPPTANMASYPKGGLDTSMPVAEPRNLPKHLRPPSNNPYEGRWRWWYASIADYRITHPGCTNREIATHIGKAENTIGYIVTTDMYREYEAQRRAHFQQDTEAVLKAKLLNVALGAVDAMQVQIDKKKDQIPLAIAKDIATSALDRLGFAPKSAPTVVVNNHQSNQSVVLPGSVSQVALEEARMAIRAVEQQRLASVGSVHVLEAKPSEPPAGPAPIEQLSEVRDGTPTIDS